MNENSNFAKVRCSNRAANAHRVQDAAPRAGLDGAAPHHRPRVAQPRPVHHPGHPHLPSRLTLATPLIKYFSLTSKYFSGICTLHMFRHKIR